MKPMIERWRSEVTQSEALEAARLLGINKRIGFQEMSALLGIGVSTLHRAIASGDIQAPEAVPGTCRKSWTPANAARIVSGDAAALVEGAE